MGAGVRVLFVVGFEEEVLEVVELVVVPEVGEVGRRAEVVDLLEVHVVVLVGLGGVGLEAEPDAPLVEELGFEHHYKC